MGASDTRASQVPQFYADFLNKPTALNNGQTLNRYWMEDSFGKYGVELVPYGPYRDGGAVALPVPHLALLKRHQRWDCPENPAVWRRPTRAVQQELPQRGADARKANVPRRPSRCDVRQPLLYVSAGHDE